VGVDVEAVFDELAGDGPPRQRRLVWTAPEDLLGRLLALFDGAATAARAGGPARIALKTNALTEPDVIEALYRASSAGVDVDVVVRGMCALRPGVAGVSERIRVRSVLGRFHEHSRLIHVRAGDEVTTLGTSADLAPRNLRRRVEVAWPLPPALGERAVEELITSYLADAAAAWTLGPDGRWSRVEDGVGSAAQERFQGQSGARSA
jgi:polyphosphate kinase